jgi:hypothetical protein
MLHIQASIRQPRCHVPCSSMQGVPKPSHAHHSRQPWPKHTRQRTTARPLPTCLWSGGVHLSCYNLESNT